MNKQHQPSSNWTSNLSETEREEFVKRLLISKDLFKRLDELIDNLQKDNNKSRIDKSSYDKPAWSEYQADTNGYERALKTVQQLLQFTKE